MQALEGESKESARTLERVGLATKRVRFPEVKIAVRDDYGRKRFIIVNEAHERAEMILEEGLENIKQSGSEEEIRYFLARYLFHNIMMWQQGSLNIH